MSLAADTVGFLTLASITCPSKTNTLLSPPQENWCLSIDHQIVYVYAVTCHLPVVFVLNSPVMYFVPGFEITIDHPHTDVVKCSQLVRGRGFLLCSLCPLLFFCPTSCAGGEGRKNHVWFNGYVNTPCSFVDLLRCLCAPPPLFMWKVLFDRVKTSSNIVDVPC